MVTSSVGAASQRYPVAVDFLRHLFGTTDVPSLPVCFGSDAAPTELVVLSWGGGYKDVAPPELLRTASAELLHHIGPTELFPTSRLRGCG